MKNTGARSSNNAIRNRGTGTINITGGTVKTDKGIAIYSISTGKIVISEANASNPTLVTSASGASDGTILFTNPPTTDPKIILEVSGGTVENTANPEGISVYFDNTAVTSENVTNYYSITNATVGKIKPAPPAAVISFDARNGVTIPSATAGTNGKITLPTTAPTWGDYTFGGWYTGIDGAGDVVTADTVHTASATAYAKWTKGDKTVRTEALSASTATPAPDQGWTWDAGENTLTLNDFTLDAKHTDSATPVSAEIALPLNATLKVVGTNTVIASDFLTDSSATDAILGTGSLTISGTGTLNASAKSIAINGGNDLAISDATINAVSTRTDKAGYAISSAGDIIINNTATVSAKSNNVAFSTRGGIVAEGATIEGANEKFESGVTTELTPKDPATPVVISFGPSIKVDAQSGTATYGTAINTTFAVTASSFGGKYPAFAPKFEWVGDAPTGVTPVFSDNDTKLTTTTTAATPAGNYNFKVVSAKTDGGNYESAEATLKVDQLGATIAWGSTSFPYNGSEQAPTATVSNKVGNDDVTVNVTGAKTDVGANYTATADSLAGTAAGNYAMPSTKPTITFTITKAAYTGSQATAPSASGATITDTTITLPPQAIAVEIVEYGYSLTADGEITWQNSNVFNGLIPETDYYFFARVEANNNHDAGATSTGTKIKTDKSDADKIIAAKAAVTAALDKFTATNATDADAMLAMANKALADAGITGIIATWDASGAFSKTDATEEDSGSITGTFKLTCGAATDTVVFNKTIAKLPSDPNAKIATVKAAIEAALNAYTATNTTTEANIKAIADKANTDSGIKTVTIAWGTPAFYNSNSTDSKDGAVTGTFDLSCTSGGNSATDTISINCPIERSDKQKLAGAIIDANNAKTGITINNGSPSSVAKGTKFVSDAEMKALEDTIGAAKLVDPNTATPAELIAATTALNDAIATFKTAIKTGTYTSGGGTPPSPPSYGGGGSGGDSTPPAVEPPTTTQNPPTTVETNIPATVDKNGNATVNVTDKIMQDAIDKAVAEANKNGTIANGISIVINVTTGGKDANTVTVNLPKTVQETVIAGQVVNTIVVVDRPDIAINMNLASIKEINKQAQADVQLSATRLDNSKLSAQAQAAIGNRPAFDLKATYENGTKAVRNFGTGSVTVEIPYTMQKGEVAGNLYAVYVDENGKVGYITNSSYDANAKVLRFATNHFSVYGIGSKASTRFADIAGHWAKDDIEFAANRGLLSGTSNTTFSPNSAMTRGMFAKALTTLSGKDMTAVVGGNMADMVTREGMAVIMQNYAKAISYTLPSVHAKNTFADSAKISTSANDSVKKLQMAGVISGKSGNVFDPQGTATRAEVSAVLRRFIELVISTDTAQGWMMNDSGKWMYYENGKAVKSGTKSIDGKSYTFNGYGETVDVPKNLNYGSYVVKKGESWWKIAHDQKCNMLELAKLNGKTIFSMIHPGDTLKIPQK